MKTLTNSTNNCKNIVLFTGFIVAACSVSCHPFMKNKTRIYSVFNFLSNTFVSDTKTFCYHPGRSILRRRSFDNNVESGRIVSYDIHKLKTLGICKETLLSDTNFDLLLMSLVPKPLGNRFPVKHVPIIKRALIPD